MENNYLYIHDWTRNGISRWKYEFIKKLKGHAYAKTQDEKINEINGNHANNVADVSRLKGIKLKSKIVHKALNTQLKPMQIISKCTKNASRATKASLQNNHN